MQHSVPGNSQRSCRSDSNPSDDHAGVSHQYSSEGVDPEDYRAIAECIPEVFFALDKNLCYQLWNKAAERFFGVPAKAVLGRNRSDVFFHADNDVAEHLYRSVIQTQKTQRVVHECRVGEKDFYIEVNAYPLEGGVAVFWKNITGQTLMERELAKYRADLEWVIEERTRELQALNERLRQEVQDRRMAERTLTNLQEQFYKLFNISPTPMSIWRFRDCRYIAVNDAWLQVTGYTRKEIINRTTFEVRGLRWRDIIWVKQQLEAGVAVRNQEVTYRTKHSENRVGLISWEPLYIDEELALLTSITDITEQKRQEESVRQHSREIISIFENMPDIIARFDRDLRVVYINNAVEMALGVSADAVIGRDYAALGLNATTAGVWQENLCQVFETGQDVVFECYLSGKNGKRHYQTRLVAEEADTKDIQYVLAVSRDITEYRRLEKEMSRLARLHLIGEMAAGLGHEIRNPMTTVRGFLQMLSKKQESAGLRDYFSMMIEELDRANSVITGFLALAKNRLVNLRELSLNLIVEKLHPLVQATALPRGKRIQLHLKPVPLLWLDEKEICQLILNLVQNGLEATPNGGTVTISTYRQEESVIMAVTDEGKGIPPEIIDKIGIPFFTTKECGTGMGMAICYSIAARHKAKIDVDTGSGGTTFYVQFPLTGQSVEDKN